MCLLLFRSTTVFGLPLMDQSFSKLLTCQSIYCSVTADVYLPLSHGKSGKALRTEIGTLLDYHKLSYTVTHTLIFPHHSVVMAWE